jgi:hypothetical protein
MAEEQPYLFVCVMVVNAFLAIFLFERAGAGILPHHLVPPLSAAHR